MGELEPSGSLRRRTGANRASNVAVIGAGYVGLTAAVCLSHLGHVVTGADLCEERVDALNNGVAPFFEPGLEQMLNEHLDQNLMFVSTARAAVANADFICLCVATPQASDGSADLTDLEHAVRDIGPTLQPGSVVITKSTVPVGTGDRIRDWLQRSDVAVVSCPEFLREGTAVADFLSPDRIVIGSNDEVAARRVVNLLAGLGASTHVVGIQSAELIKYASNAFLATKLSFVNEIATLSERIGGDINEVLLAVGSDHRIGTDFFQPGPGWGGSCFPKDVAALTNLASNEGLSLPLVAAVASSNTTQLDHTADRVVELLNDNPDRAKHEAVVAAWGLTFKANTSDRRESPSIAVLQRLKPQVGALRGYDPTVHEPLNEVPELTIAADPYGAVVGADVLVVLTEWEEFANLDWKKVAELMRSPVVFDARGLLPHQELAEAGLTCRAIGR